MLKIIFILHILASRCLIGKIYKIFYYYYYWFILSTQNYTHQKDPRGLKKFLIQKILFFLIKGSSWSYENDGAYNWISSYSQCNGYWQSPINIDTLTTFYDQTLVPIEFINYNLSIQWLLNLTQFTGIFYRYIYNFETLVNKSMG